MFALKNDQFVNANGLCIGTTSPNDLDQWIRFKYSKVPGIQPNCIIWLIDNESWLGQLIKRAMFLNVFYTF